MEDPGRMAYIKYGYIRICALSK